MVVVVVVVVVVVGSSSGGGGGSSSSSSSSSSKNLTIEIQRMWNLKARVMHCTHTSESANVKTQNSQRRN